MDDYFKLENLPTYKLTDLVGRRLDILEYESADGKIIVAKDVKTEEGFVLNLEIVPEQRPPWG